MTHPVTLHLSQRSDGMEAATATWCGREYRATSRNGAALALARDLMAAGLPDGPWQAVGADGRVRLHGPSLHRLAALTVSDPPNGRGCRFTRWEPYAAAEGGA